MSQIRACSSISASKYKFTSSFLLAIAIACLSLNAWSQEIVKGPIGASADDCYQTDTPYDPYSLPEVIRKADIVAVVDVMTTSPMRHETDGYSNRCWGQIKLVEILKENKRASELPEEPYMMVVFTPNLIKRPDELATLDHCVIKPNKRYLIAGAVTFDYLMNSERRIFTVQDPNSKPGCYPVFDLQKNDEILSKFRNIIGGE